MPIAPSPEIAASFNRKIPDLRRKMENNLTSAKLFRPVVGSLREGVGFCDRTKGFSALPENARHPVREVHIQENNFVTDKDFLPCADADFAVWMQNFTLEATTVYNTSDCQGREREQCRDHRFAREHRAKPHRDRQQR